MQIWEPKPPGTLWATPGLLRDSYLYQCKGESCEHSNDTVYLVSRGGFLD